MMIFWFAQGPTGSPQAVLDFFIIISNAKGFLYPLQEKSKIFKIG